MPGTAPFLTLLTLKTDLSWGGANTEKLTLNKYCCMKPKHEHSIR